MKTKVIAIIMMMLFLASITVIAVPARAEDGTPTIDGVITAGEWDAYSLGTSVTDWGGGMSVDVYGFADDTYLYVAYVADTSQPGWSVACGLGVNCNFYYRTPQSASWPDQGYTLLATGGYPDEVCQTDDSDWVNKGSFADNGIDIAYEDIMYGTPPGTNVAELKIPLSLLTYAGTDYIIRLGGQYWQYDWATPFYVTFAPPPAYWFKASGGGVFYSDASWKKLETITVSATEKNPTYSSSVLKAGETYLIKVSGTYGFNGTGKMADAEWSTNDNWATIIQKDPAPWVDGLEARGILDLLMDENVDTDWGEYNPSHAYSMVYTGKGAKASFVISDWYGAEWGSPWDNQAGMYDNSGSLTVTIYEQYRTFGDYCTIGLIGMSLETSEGIGDRVPCKGSGTFVDHDLKIKISFNIETGAIVRADNLIYFWGKAKVFDIYNHEKAYDVPFRLGLVDDEYGRTNRFDLSCYGYYWHGTLLPDSEVTVWVWE